MSFAPESGDLPKRLPPAARSIWSIVRAVMVRIWKASLTGRRRCRPAGCRHRHMTRRDTPGIMRTVCCSISPSTELSLVIDAVCSANYVRVHHQGSSHYLCVHRATILPGGPKFTAEPKQPLSPNGQSAGKVKTK
jgi:hypothetical protein